MIKICLKQDEIEMHVGGGGFPLGNGKQIYRRRSKLGMEIEE